MVPFYPRADTESRVSLRNYAILCLLAPMGSVARLSDLIGVVRIARSDGLLVVLAHAGAGNLVGKSPPLRQPPPNDLVREELPQIGCADRRAFVDHDDGQRPFLPALVGNADDRGLEHVRVGDQAVLQL